MFIENNLEITENDKNNKITTTSISLLNGKDG